MRAVVSVRVTSNAIWPAVTPEAPCDPASETQREIIANVRERDTHFFTLRRLSVSHAEFRLALIQA